MSNAPKTTVELPEDLRAFAEERVRPGRSSSVTEFVMRSRKTAARCEQPSTPALAEIAAVLGVERTPDELIAEVSAEVGRQPPSQTSIAEGLVRRDKPAWRKE